MQIEMTEMNTISTIIATTVTGITIAAILSFPKEMVIILKLCWTHLCWTHLCLNALHNIYNMSLHRCDVTAKLI